MTRKYWAGVNLFPPFSLVDGIVDNSTLTMATDCHRGAANGTFDSKSGTVHRPDSKFQGKFTLKINEAAQPEECKCFFVNQINNLGLHSTPTLISPCEHEMYNFNKVKA